MIYLDLSPCFTLLWAFVEEYGESYNYYDLYYHLFYHQFLCTLDSLLVQKGVASMNTHEYIVGCVIMDILIGSHFNAIETHWYMLPFEFWCV